MNIIPTSEDINYFRNIVNFLIKKANFHEILRYSNLEIFNKWFKDNKNIFKDKITIEHGLTKMVIISKENNESSKKFVAKIPFSYYKNNYYESESDFYSIIDENVKDCFAASYNVGESFYLMERADILSEEELVEYSIDRKYSPCNYSLTGIDYDFFSNNPELKVEEEEDPEFLAIDRLFLDYLGLEKYHSLCSFCINNRISDLHSGNIGFIFDRPVLIDYSTY